MVRMLRLVGSVLLSALAGMNAAYHLVTVAERLRDRGHRVSVVSGEQARAWYRDLDVEFHAVPEEALPEPLQTLPPLAQRARQVFARVQSSIIRPLPQQWATVQRVIADAHVDVVISDALFLGGSTLSYLPRAARPAVIVLGCYPPWLPDPGLPAYGLGIPPQRDSADVLRATALGAFTAPTYVALSRSFNRSLERTLGVRTRGDIRRVPALADAWLQLTVPRFSYDRGALPSNFRFIGPVHPAGVDPVPDWWSPLTEPHVVAVRAQGSAAVRDVVAPTVQAFAGTEDTVVIAGVSRAQVEATLGALPPNVHFEERMPWSRLLPQRTVVVSDGDYLHTQHALRYGIPVVVAGTLEVDVETGARVQWSGTGVNLKRRRPDPATIRGAVRRIRDSGAYRLAAARIAVEIEYTDAEASICRAVDAVLRGERGPLLNSDPRGVLPASAGEAG